MMQAWWLFCICSVIYWIVSFTYPNPDQVKYQEINETEGLSVKADEFGTLHSSISADEKMVLFSCELRLCAVNKSNKVVNLEKIE